MAKLKTELGVFLDEIEKVIPVIAKQARKIGRTEVAVLTELMRMTAYPVEGAHVTRLIGGGRRMVGSPTQKEKIRFIAHNANQSVLNDFREWITTGAYNTPSKPWPALPADIGKMPLNTRPFVDVAPKTSFADTSVVKVDTDKPDGWGSW